MTDEVLREAIHAHVLSKFEGIENATRIRQMSESLSDFVLTAVEKFYNGFLEHGGDLKDVDLDQEIAKEAIDIFWYNAAKKW